MRSLAFAFGGADTQSFSPLRFGEGLGEGFFPNLFQRAIPVAVIHIDRPHDDVMSTCISHQLSWSVKAHRLAVENRGGEGRGGMAFQPRGDVSQQSEARGMRLRESVFAEAP